MVTLNSALAAKINACNWLPRNLGRVAKKNQPEEDASCTRSLFCILCNFFPCANCPSCEQGQLPSASGAWDRKLSWQAHAAVQSWGLRGGRKPIFFFICVAKNPEQCHQSQPRWWELKFIKDSAKLMLSLRLSDTHSESNVGKK